MSKKIECELDDDEEQLLDSIIAQATQHHSDMAMANLCTKLMS